MYKVSRYVSYLNKKEVYAVYCNFNLYFFKGITYKWFTSILKRENIYDIDPTFIDYLLEKEIIYKGECKNV